MPRTFWTATATGILTLCITGCGGGGSDIISDTCNHLQSCNSLSVVGGASTMSQCIDNGHAMLSKAFLKEQTELQLSDCLQQLHNSGCSSYADCISISVDSSGPSQ